MPFPNGGGSVGFQLKYPANSQFVAVVSMSFHCGSTCLSFRYFLASLSFVVSFQTWNNPMPMPTYGHLSPPFLKHRRVVLLWPFIDITTHVGPSRYHILPTPPSRSHAPPNLPLASCLHNFQSTSIKTILPLRLSIAPQKPPSIRAPQTFKIICRVTHPLEFYFGIPPPRNVVSWPRPWHRV